MQPKCRVGKMSRFFVDKSAIKDNRIFITDKDDVKHISKVLRLRSGDVIEVSDSEEYEYEAAVVSISDGEVECLIRDKQRFSREPGVKVTLYQGIPKKGKMEVIIQKCVELGVIRIVPVFTGRTVAVDKGGFEKKIERWQKISDEAVKQCRRGVIPQIADPIKFPGLIDEIKTGYDLVVFLYENEGGITMKNVLREFGDSEAGRKTNPEIAVIIGPEGGFSTEEASEIKVAGAKSASLGKTVLRTETAGVAAMAMIMYELEL